VPFMLGAPRFGPVDGWLRRACPAAVAAVAVALTGVALHSRTASADGDPARLNVVVILSDDERADGTSVMPNVRRLLADHGITFTDYHVTTSECGPSRASILTGQYSHHTGVLGNFGPHSYPAFDDRSDLAVWLHAAGYRTALVGKYINDYTSYGRHQIPPGWDDWQAIDSVPMEAYYDYTLNENGRLVHFGRAPGDYSTTVLTDKAVDFIRHARSPFFLYFAPAAPHLPAIPAKQDQGRLENLAPLHSPAFDQRDIGKEPWRSWHKGMLKAAARIYVDDVRRRQEGSLLALDRSVGRLVRVLRERHELDRTVIVYTSDNGFLWGEHRLGGKLWPYEESTHVPLIVRTPWKRTPSRNDEPVVNIDLAPTISALAGVKPRLPEDGRSFLPLLHGRRIRWRSAFLVEYLGANKLRAGGPPPYVAVQTKRWLYVEYSNGWRELYDLRRDPWELVNLSGDVRERHELALLHALVHRLRDASPTDA
jgi:N-acetylglucosamine-6-sulfatase